MARKAIVLDLDGTLLDSQKAVSPRSVGAIQACLLEGHLVIVATARALRTTLRLLPADLHSCYLVLCNGARTVRGGSVVYRNEIAAELVLRLTEELIAIGLSAAIETDDQLYSDLKAAGSPAWESRPLGEYPRTAACKLLALIAAGMNEMILRKLIPPELDYVITDRGTLLQIQVRSCSKATASRAIFEVEKVALGDTYALGMTPTTSACSKAWEWGSRWATPCRN